MYIQLIFIVLFTLTVVVLSEHNSKELKKLKGAKTAKPNVEKTKSVSSDKVKNGGRNGVTSGGPGSFPLPVAIPFPMIPLQGQGQPSTIGKNKKKRKKQKKAQKNESESHKQNSIHNVYLDHKVPSKSKTLKTNKSTGKPKTFVDKSLIKRTIDNSLTRLKRDLIDDEEDDTDNRAIITKAQLREQVKNSLRQKEIANDMRLKRSFDEDADDLSEEEKLLQDSWLSDNDDEFIPSVEKVYFTSPSDLDFIWKGHSVLNKAYNSIMPELRVRDIEKRSIEEGENNEEISDSEMFLNEDSEKDVELNKRDIDEDSQSNRGNDGVDLMFYNAESESENHMNTRREVSPVDELAEDADEEVDIVRGSEYEDEEVQDRDVREAALGDEPPLSLEDAENQVRNAEKAASALTHLEMQVGIDPEHLVSDTHKYVVSLQNEKLKYDEDIRMHIERAQEAEKRASIAVHDEVSKRTEISKDVSTAKRQLDQDRQKIEEINTELKQLKDIEIMATGLEVAKYLAKERARHNLEQAQAKASITQPPVQHINTEPHLAASVPVLPVMTHPPVSPDISSLSSSIPNIGGQTMSLPSVMLTPQSPTPGTFEHQMGSQRNEDNRPTFNASPLQMPLTQYFSNYLQSKNMMQNQFSSLAQPHGPSSFYSSQAINQPAVQFLRPQSVTPANNHVIGDQRDMPARLHSTYIVKPALPVLPPMQYASAFARVSKPNHVGAPDHQITKIDQPHRGPNDANNKGSDESNEDWGLLSFPGTTYSPPPSWVHRPMGLYMRAQPARVPYQYRNNFNQQVPLHQHQSASFAPYQPPQLAEALTAISPMHQFSQQSYLSASPSTASYVSSPPVSSAPLIPILAQPSYQNSIFHENNMEARPGATQAYAQQSKQGAQVGEVINAAPQDEVVTMNKKPPPPPPVQPAPDMSGTLPGWMGAVDSAKYDQDISDRLREKNKDRNKQKDKAEDNVKREYLKLVNAEKKLTDVDKASRAVTHIETAVGFDPGSIAKMVDFVKTAAVKDVNLSQDAVNRDKETLQKIEGDDGLKKKSEIPTKKTYVDSVALQHANAKLKTDEAILADARDRLDKIQKMELIVTEVEVAKFYASMKAEKEVQGAKRTLTVFKK